MHLTDCFTELVAYVTHFLRTAAVRQPSYQEVRREIDLLLASGESCVRREGFSRDDFELARFAVCAWIDEAVLSSAWSEKSLWLREQLQRLHYNTTEAGEEFFTRLNALGLHQREVREVYYLCLALGFTGRFCKPGDEYQLEQVKTAQLKLLVGSSVGLPSLERTELFPEAYPAGAPAMAPARRRVGFSPLAAVCLAGPAVFFVILFFVYRFTLSGVGENFLRTVPY
ncbi:type IV / VI secretion system protein, DotU family [Geobacter metallireducens RCH3]|uniref:Type VI secretion system inner membrane protein TssL n=1 Tax=Geobacter metallireducens (strain ATCC 53774 / DSM 7210 / GS-15) TaxID=269799 RepID=Q39Z06_GEOMG|nr:MULTISPECIES: DotU family type IV/VI secretion system protein [Geobacter]ABB30518.1 type VI secretion system inner membrane protein TssL [Geobacter metallireducens GS-15]EHP85959.1 type IV / VI secretion system protein, DotU family [Geobacter metallireducens RCH3]MBT1076827.1 DotU family type IV/VI secretion system protein [Geobacter grbiciae]